MKREELMIGNRLYDPIKKEEVIYNLDIDPENLAPIELSEEYLKKEGFEVDNISSLLENNRFVKDIKGCRLSISYENGFDWDVQIDDDHFMSLGGGFVRYFHELQIMFYILTKQFYV